MKPHEIRALLVKKRIKQVDLAHELGVTLPAVNGVVNGYWMSRRIAEHIAKRLGRKVEKLWPDLAA